MQSHAGHAAFQRLTEDAARESQASGPERRQTNNPQRDSEFDRAVDQRASDRHQDIAEISEAKGKACISRSAQRLPSHKRDSDSEYSREVTERCVRRKHIDESGTATTEKLGGDHESEAVDEHAAVHAAEVDADMTNEGHEGMQWRPYIRRAGVQSMDLDAICMPAR